MERLEEEAQTHRLSSILREMSSVEMTSVLKKNIHRTTHQDRYQTRPRMVNN